MDDSTRSMHGDSAQPTSGLAVRSSARMAVWAPLELREQAGQGGFDVSLPRVGSKAPARGGGEAPAGERNVRFGALPGCAA